MSPRGDIRLSADDCSAVHAVHVGFLNLRSANPEPLEEGMVVQSRQVQPTIGDLDDESGMTMRIETRSTFSVRIEGLAPEDVGALIRDVRAAVEPLLALLETAA